MKIAILSFYQNHVSRGVETFVHELKNNVDKKNLKLRVYAPNKIPTTPKPQKPNLLTYLFLDKHSLSIKKFTKKTLDQLEQDPPDILMPLNNGWMSWLSKKFCQKHSIKLVLPGFAGISWEDKLNLKLNPDAFVAVTKTRANWARTINPQANIKIINIGVNIDRFKPQGKKYPHHLKPPVVLCIAGPQKYKRIDLAIKAVKQLKDTSLLLVGQQSKETLSLGAKLLGKRFKHIKVNYQDLDPVYRSANAFTLPSESIEAYGIVILEALASNLPVVVNNDPVRKELVGNTGLLINPQNQAEYVSALKTALTKDFDNQPRQQALKFSWEKITKQYQQLWQSLLK
ncbi:glycosyltransferase family 4 protein [Patescibacteria group bacterium]